MAKKQQQEAQSCVFMNPPEKSDWAESLFA
jgi:hypothetical protein